MYWIDFSDIWLFNSDIERGTFKLDPHAIVVCPKESEPLITSSFSYSSIFEAKKDISNFYCYENLPSIRMSIPDPILELTTHLGETADEIRKNQTSDSFTSETLDSNFAFRVAFNKNCRSRIEALHVLHSQKTLIFAFLDRNKNTQRTIDIDPLALELIKNQSDSKPYSFVLRHRQTKKFYVSSSAWKIEPLSMSQSTIDTSEESNALYLPTEGTICNIPWPIFDILMLKNRFDHLLHTIEKRHRLESQTKTYQKTETLSTSIQSVQEDICHLKLQLQSLTGRVKKLESVSFSCQESPTNSKEIEHVRHASMLLYGALRWRQKELVSALENVFFVTKGKERAENKTRITRLRGMRHLVVLSLEVEKTEKSEKSIKSRRVERIIEDDQTLISTPLTSDSNNQAPITETTDLLIFPVQCWIWNPWEGLALLASLLLLLAKYFVFPPRFLPTEDSELYPLPDFLQDPQNLEQELGAAGVRKNSTKSFFSSKRFSFSTPPIPKLIPADDPVSVSPRDSFILLPKSHYQKYHQIVYSWRSQEHTGACSLLKTGAFWDGSYPRAAAAPSSTFPLSNALCNSKGAFGNQPTAVPASVVSNVKDWDTLGDLDMSVLQMRRVYGRLRHVHHMTEGVSL
eukprot:GHVP01029623.1.p1 GENE.GHVP01029623.1~~GHVP01029623.1.p1  ORF type:complete len:629 (-),score=100.77 GHVP01029623.1:459-2345(-)